MSHKTMRCIMKHEVGTAASPLFLVIDDDPSAIRLVSEVLKKDGRVIFATNGRDGLIQARTRSPDIVLLDAEMPGMSGFDVCQKLHDEPSTKEIPIIFITARSDIDSEIEALNAGAVDFITKPINPEIARIRVNNQLTIRRLSDQLRQASRVDSLTGIFNRRWFDEVLSTEWARAIRSNTPVGLLMIDIDCFKNYNDNYGHLSGDACLTAVAETISGVVRDPPDFAARYGGEEFVCLLPGANLSAVENVSKRILDAVRDRHIPHGNSGIDSCVTVSIGGVSLIPDQNLTSKALLEEADTRLYKAKNGGRNRHVL